MTPRQPSIVPFLVLSGLAVLLALFLPMALASQNVVVGALFLLLSLLLCFFAISVTNLLRSWAGADDLGAAQMLLPTLWMVPLLVLAVQKSPLALLCTIPFLYSLRQHLPTPPAPWGNSFLAAAGLHGVLALQVSGRPSWALVVMLVVAGLIFWAAEQGNEQGNEQKTRRRATQILSGALAVGFGLWPFLPLPAQESSSQALAAMVLARPRFQGDSSEKNPLYGIVLRPKAEEKDYKLPPPPVLRMERFHSVPAKPLEIPFSGVYWIFQPPLNAPPEKSPQEEGTPADFRFRSEDTAPVRLEARQSFLKPFPTQRIQGISVVLLSKDKYPDTLSLQVFATNSQERRMRMNLGIEEMAFMLESNGVPQTLRFAVPAQPALSEFDGLVLRFHARTSRQEIVPRISVQKFVIHPR